MRASDRGLPVCAVPSECGVQWEADRVDLRVKTQQEVDANTAIGACEGLRGLGMLEISLRGLGMLRLAWVGLGWLGLGLRDGKHHCRPYLHLITVQHCTVRYRRLNVQTRDTHFEDTQGGRQRRTQYGGRTVVHDST